MDNVEELKNKLNDTYERLQTLAITPSLPNMEKLVQSLYDIRDVYNGLDKVGVDCGRATDNP